jgi:uncharacterized LabA/DUF88 family protein
MSDSITTPTFLQVDLPYLFTGARKKGERKIDFEKIMSHFKARETEYLMSAIIYLIRNEDLYNSSKFESKLQSLGYIVKAKNAMKAFKEGKVVYRGNQDVLIAIDSIDNIDNYKKLILMSGSGDMIEVCRYVKNKGKKVEIWCFEESHNRELITLADKFYYITEDFFMKILKVPTFGFNFGGIQ